MTSLNSASANAAVTTPSTYTGTTASLTSVAEAAVAIPAALAATPASAAPIAAIWVPWCGEPSVTTRRTRDGWSLAQDLTITPPAL